MNLDVLSNYGAEKTQLKTVRIILPNSKNQTLGSSTAHGLITNGNIMQKIWSEKIQSCAWWSYPIPHYVFTAAL